MCVRERVGRETDRQIDRDRDSGRDRDRERQKKLYIEREGGRKGGTDS